MKERPILFSAPMVRAILDGRKTQTRRIVKPQQPRECQPLDAPYDFELTERNGDVTLYTLEQFVERCPYGRVGDRLWVRETWQPIWAEGRERRPTMQSPEGWNINYAADGVIEYRDDEHGLTTRCKPGIHMPRWMSRIDLEITNVRVEQLWSLTDADALAEGVFDEEAGWHKERFRSLWTEINGIESWPSNPWVWVVEFKRIEAQERAP